MLRCDAFEALFTHALFIRGRNQVLYNHFQFLRMRTESVHDDDIWVSAAHKLREFGPRILLYIRVVASFDCGAPKRPKCVVRDALNQVTVFVEADRHDLARAWIAGAMRHSKHPGHMTHLLVPFWIALPAQHAG